LRAFAFKEVTSEASVIVAFALAFWG